jgi:hypothetical protein
MPVPEDKKANGIKNRVSMIRVLIFLAVLLLAGCAAGNYGYLRQTAMLPMLLNLSMFTRNTVITI